MKRILCLTAAALLTGCAQFKNEAYCSGKRMVFVSWYYGLGVAAKVDNGAEHCEKAEPVSEGTGQPATGRQ